MITALAVLVSMVSLDLVFWALSVQLFTDAAVPGWASIVIPQFLLSGVQLLSLGVIGEYVAKILVETKRRPLYFLSERSESAVTSRADAALPVGHSANVPPTA